MKLSLAHRISRTDWLLIGLYYLLAFSIIFFAEWAEEDVPLFSRQSLPLFFHLCKQFALQILALVVIVYGVFAVYFPKRNYVLLFALTILVLFVQLLLSRLISPVVLGSLGPDYLATILWGIIDNFSDVTPIGLLLIARQYYASQNRLLSLERNQKESELRRLESQVDPHFLFNNLNILDILIENNPQQARAFTRHLSALYRYLIRHRNADLVPLQEEWAFCQHYVFLLQQRFDELFQFELTANETDLSSYLIPPAVMQTLLENVVKHNTALPSSPITVQVDVANHALSVSNTLRPKAVVTDSTGTGLDNLRRRLELLTGETITIRQTTDTFQVIVPLAQIQA